MTIKKLSGKNVLITGASHGIGRAIAIAMAREGANILFTYNKDHKSAEDLIAKIVNLGVICNAVQINAQDHKAVDSLVSQAFNFFEKIHVLVNNVGVTTRTSFMDTSEENFDEVMKANFRFPFFLTQKLIGHMIERGIEGSIINISSISSFKAISKMAHYQSSKAALSMLSKSLAFEFAHHGIRVNTISPGLTATQGNRNQWQDNPQIWSERGKDIPLGRTGKPDDHAGAAVFLASNEATWVTGADIIIDGGESTI